MYTSLADFLPIAMCDCALISPLLQDMLQQLQPLPSRQLTGKWLVLGLIYGPGPKLFQVVIMRTYLEREPEDDAQIYDLIVL